MQVAGTVMPRQCADQACICRKDALWLPSAQAPEGKCSQLHGKITRDD